MSDAEPKKSVGILGWGVALFFGYIIYSVVSPSGSSREPSTNESGAPPRLTGADLQAKLDRERAENAAKQKKDAAFQLVVIQIATLKSSMRNPPSFVLEDASGSDDGKLLCVTYRAQNGFGGMNREFITMTDKKWSREPSIWNRRCANKTLTDWNLAKYALK